MKNMDEKEYKEKLREQLKLLQSPKKPDDTEYMKHYDMVLDFVIDKVLNDVSLYTHIPIEEFPDSIFQTIVMLASNFIDSFGLINDDETNANQDIKEISEGDTKVVYADKRLRLQQSLASSSINGNFTALLNSVRRLP
ncbi:hypothetical protein MQC79_03475 [Lactococcus garvieae]|uniref:hypothetical protein n=1 Tax=Lactococcus garvieae TaxID=1363 RepID=UPI001F61410F|nr:hypothetical protein [Lactococcus garvieae]MCI3860144.1 hypothetical protein [Lactococcus garvieae]